MSTEKRAALRQAVVYQIRHFIAATILYNQGVADRVGLHPTDMQSIHLLDLLGPVTPGELARRTGLTTGGVTVMLDRLEKAGYVKREPNPSDRRSLLVRINAKKLEKLHSFYSEINQQLAAFLESTPERDLEIVAAFFTRMQEIRENRLPAAKKASRSTFSKETARKPPLNRK